MVMWYWFGDTVFDRYKLNITWMSNIKEGPYKPRLHVSVNLLAGWYHKVATFRDLTFWKMTAEFVEKESKQLQKEKKICNPWKYFERNISQFIKEDKFHISKWPSNVIFTVQLR